MRFVTTDFAPVGAALASPARSAMLNALLDGDPVSAGELARVAGVAPPTASGHLSVLLRAGLVRDVRAGRHRQFVLAGPEVASALETLAHISPSIAPRSLRQSLESDALREGRTCYDHLAGRLGVGVLDAMVTRRWLRAGTDGFDVTRAGRSGLLGLGVDLDAARAARRAFARPCLDWTERRPHLAGALGAAVAGAMFDRGWLQRRPGSRAVRATPSGRAALEAIFGIAPPASGRRA